MTNNRPSPKMWFGVQALLLIYALIGCLPADPNLTSDTNTRAPVEEIALRPQTPGVSTVPITFAEAPMLTERVRQGLLPPVKERLPKPPLILKPIEEIGRYGGTLRRALTGDIAQSPGVSKTMSESLLGYSRPIGSRIEPALAVSWTFENNGRVAIFHLRKNVRWSDGVPFTANDVLFYWEDMLFDENARQGLLPPSRWVVDGEAIQLKKVDTNTLRFSSSKPLGRIMQDLAGHDVFAYPKHVLSAWHPRYNPEATYEDFKQRTTRAMLLMTPGIPTLQAWHPVAWDRGQRLVYERNPYYWKVDTEGNQLPYADSLRFEVIRDTQVILLKFINGEIDIFGRYSRHDMFQTLKSEETRGTFRVGLAGPGEGPAFYLNWDADEPALREAFRDLRVRQALSYGMNREEINEILYQGKLVPAGYTIGPQSPYYSEAAAKKYATFDLNRARALLDEAGYVDHNGDGWREFKDGSPFAFTIDVVAPGMWADICQLVTEQWMTLGLKAVVNGAMRDLIWPRRDNGSFDVHFWLMEGAADPLDTLHDWAITGPSKPFWHRRAFENPPDWLREATEAFIAVRTTRDTALVRSYMERARDLHTENVPVIVSGFVYHVWAASTRLGNVPMDGGTTSDLYRGFGRPLMHEQMFVKKLEP